MTATQKHPSLPFMLAREAAALIVLILALLFVPINAEAQTTNSPQKELLYEQLAKASSEPEGIQAANALWQFWTDEAPTPELKDKLIRGMEKRNEADYPWAEDLFNEVIKEAPDYAEGWNQRGFVKFLRGDLEGSLLDLEKAVELEPRHFGALSGMYHVLRLLNRPKVAVRALHMAITVHPWIKERNDLPEELRPKKIPVEDL